jgi:tetratricopeptide (TPR) repeat protein
VRKRFAAAALMVFAASAQTPSADPLDHARRAFDAGGFAEAARLFEKARTRDKACEISLYLAMARYRLHQVEDALTAFQEAVNCDPKLTLAWIALGEAYTERGSDVEALAAYDRALSREPQNTGALRGAAALCMRAKLNAKAVALLKVLTKKEPADADAHAELGDAYFGTGNIGAAEAEFTRALQLNPKASGAMLGQANVLVRKGEERRAIAMLQQGDPVHPESL